MYPLQGTPSQNEQHAGEIYGVNQPTFKGAIIQMAVVAGSVVLLRWVMSTNRDEIILTGMHGCIRGLQVVARIVGQWAINAEDSYNEMVSTLH